MRCCRERANVAVSAAVAAGFWKAHSAAQSLHSTKLIAFEMSVDMSRVRLSAFIRTCIERGGHFASESSAEWLYDIVVECAVRTGVVYVADDCKYFIIEQVVRSGLEVLYVEQNREQVRAACTLTALAKLQEIAGENQSEDQQKRRIEVDQPVSNRKRQKRDQRVVQGDARVTSLTDKALDVVNVDAETMALLSANYTSHPHLALLYYHCCSTNPEARVYSNEHVVNGNAAETSDTVERLKKVLDLPPDVDEIVRCQQLNGRSDPRQSEVRFCASCCEMLVGVSDQISHVSFAELPEIFFVTPAEKENDLLISRVLFWKIISKS